MLRKSVAAGQQIMEATVHVGSSSVNVLSMLLETIDLLVQLASHTHPDTGSPTNAAAFSGTQTTATVTKGKYQSIIA